MTAAARAFAPAAAQSFIRRHRQREIAHRG
jgi:hypothetical protein